NLGVQITRNWLYASNISRTSLTLRSAEAIRFCVTALRAVKLAATWAKAVWISVSSVSLSPVLDSSETSCAAFLNSWSRAEISPASSLNELTPSNVGPTARMRSVRCASSRHTLSGGHDLSDTSSSASKLAEWRYLTTVADIAANLLLASNVSRRRPRAPYPGLVAAPEVVLPLPIAPPLPPVVPSLR